MLNITLVLYLWLFISLFIDNNVTYYHVAWPDDLLYVLYNAFVLS